MATTRPFAYNPGSAIPGTEQVGSIAYGLPTAGFVSTGLEWWNGPDEDLGYVIAHPVPSDTQPTQIPGVFASVGFFRSDALTEGSFIDLADLIAGPSGGGPFGSGATAKTWLNNNGYWTSFEGSTGATGYGFNLVALPYTFPSAGNSIMNESGGGATSGSNNPNLLATPSRGFYFSNIDNTSTDRSSYYSTFLGQNVTITLSQDGNSAVYTGNTGAFKEWTSAGTTGYVFGTNIGVPPSGTPSGTATLVQASPSQFSFGSPVYVTLSLT